MLLKKIIKLAKKYGWEEQSCGITGTAGSIGTNFSKDGTILTVSITKEGSMTYPDKDEIKDMFGMGRP